MAIDVHLRDVRYFVATAEELNFTAAADRLHISQPALSSQIRRLETTLGVNLFERDHRQVRLTRAGEALLEHARPLGASWEATVADVEAAGRSDQAVLRIGMQTVIGRDLYPAAVAHFKALRPGWHLDLRLHPWDDPSAGLLDHQADLAFLWLPIPWPELDHQVLVTEPRWVALSTHHPLADHTVIAFVDLLDEPFLALPDAAGPIRDFWLALTERGGTTPRIATTSSTADDKLEAIAAGEGVALLAAGNAAIYQRPGIVCRPVEGLSPCSLAIAWRRDNNRGAVLDFLKACTEAPRRTS